MSKTNTEVGSLGERLVRDCLLRCLKHTPKQDSGDYAYDNRIDELKLGAHGIDIFAITERRGIDFFEVKSSRRCVKRYKPTPASKGPGQANPENYITSKMHEACLYSSMNLPYLSIDDIHRDSPPTAKQDAIKEAERSHTYQNWKNTKIHRNRNDIIGDFTNQNINSLLEYVAKDGRQYRFFLVVVDHVNDNSIRAQGNERIEIKFYKWESTTHSINIRSMTPLVTVSGKKSSGWVRNFANSPNKDVASGFVTDWKIN